MSSLHTIAIRVSPGAKFDPALLRQLENYFPVVFAVGPARGAGAVAEIRIGNFGSLTDAVPVIELPSDEGGDVQERKLSVRFEDKAEVPFPFRGRKLQVVGNQPTQGLTLRPGEQVLATVESVPVWSFVEVNGHKCFRSALVFPTLSADGSVRDVLNGDRFLELLPVLEFLRLVCHSDLFQSPRLRAGFIFDDPNLHWPSYGYVDYREVAKRAEVSNYHVSFATIPLDAWFTHGRTAQVFRDNASRLSLCVHGNDHIKHELARDYSEAERVHLLRQAIRRIEGLERRAGVSVCRVMVPPHGACKDTMLAQIPQCGFEAACISHGSLQAHNKGKPWTASLGYRHSELVEGCAVMPRWAFSGNAENVILLAAYLGQPMILRGHHQDLKAGVELLDKNAGIINSLGNVTWSNMTGLSRANYLTRSQGSTLYVRPGSPKVTIDLPETTTSVVLENVASAGWNDWQLEAGLRVSTGEPFQISSQNGRKITVMARTEVPNHTANGAFRTRPWPFVRRLITEGRDRLLAR